MSTSDIMEQNSCLFSILSCILLTFCYVASLYVWRSNLSRDHPTTIKRRFVSVFCVMVFAPFLTQYFLTERTIDRGDMFQQLGLRTSGLLTAMVAPLFLTVILFLGPLTMHVLSGSWKLYAEPWYWLSNCEDWMWVRNQFMAPLSEEWVFRACMMPLLLQCLEPFTAIFMGPLLFGIAHFHHMLERLRAGFDFRTALLVSSFQFTYTSLFGAYSAYLFARTGHFVAPLMAHMFCNHMGFPNFGEVFHYPPLQRVLIIFCFLLGFALWCLLLTTLTSPEYYGNTVHWET